MKKFLICFFLICAFAIPAIASTKSEVQNNLSSIQKILDKFTDDTCWMLTVNSKGRVQAIPMDEKQYRAMQALDAAMAMEVVLEQMAPEQMIEIHQQTSSEDEDDIDPRYDL